MLDAAVHGRKVTKSEFDAAAERLRLQLLNAQFDLARGKRFSVVLLIAGDDRIACNEFMQRIHAWMDARSIDTHVFLRPTDEESARPRFWRYWRALPPRGRIGMFYGGWAMRAISNRVSGEAGRKKFAVQVERARTFEKTLADDGVLILKFWLHRSKKDHKKRLKKAKRSPDEEWRVDEIDWRICDVIDEAVPVVEEYLRTTHARHAPWHVVESSDRRYRDLACMRTIADAIVERLESPKTESAEDDDAEHGAMAAPDTLGGVDLCATLDESDYDDALEDLRVRLHRLAHRARNERQGVLLAFEGWDAAGKGGCIRRVTSAMDVRDYAVMSVAAPTDEELARHYLWRFWRRLPSAGRIAIFDRTWYGRVLVERVEGFASEAEWRRAYAEINDFEGQIADDGWVVRKYWLHIDSEVQLARFRAREEAPYKRHKITDEDYRNREKWGDYAVAVNEMIARTSTRHAPWEVVAANDKKWARIRILESVCAALEEKLD